MRETSCGGRPDWPLLRAMFSSEAIGLLCPKNSIRTTTSSSTTQQSVFYQVSSFPVAGWLPGLLSLEFTSRLDFFFGPTNQHIDHPVQYINRRAISVHSSKSGKWGSFGPQKQHQQQQHHRPRQRPRHKKHIVLQLLLRARGAGESLARINSHVTVLTGGSDILVLLLINQVPLYDC